MYKFSRHVMFATLIVRFTLISQFFQIANLEKKFHVSTQALRIADFLSGLSVKGTLSPRSNRW